MSNQIAPITERQLDLITRAHCDANGLIEPLLELKGGAKLKMIDSLAQRGLIEQMNNQWRITDTAIAIIKGEVQPEEVLPAVKGAATSPTPLPIDDPEPVAAVAAAKENQQQEQPNTATRRIREHSKQASVIQMLQRPEGTTITQISEATGWQAHTVRGTFFGTFKKKLGLTIVSDKQQGGERVYRIV